MSAITQPIGRAYPGYSSRPWAPELHDLVDFFANNLYGVIGTARSAALRSYEVERNRILRQYLPGIDLVGADNFSIAIKATQITGPQVKEMEQAVAAIDPASYRAPYPDFFQLSADQQTDIVQLLGSEWEELCFLLHNADPRILTVATNRATAPLKYLPVRVLKEAIEVNPAIDPAKLCHAFMHAPLRFGENVTRLRASAAAAALARVGTERQRTELSTAATDGETATNKEVAAVEFMRAVELMRQYDHARITVGEKRFYMPLERPNAVLAARVLTAVIQAGDVTHIEGDAAVKLIWRQMPEAERELFYARASDRWKGSAIIRAGVMETFRKLLSPLGLTRETSGEKFKIEKNPIVSFEAEPPEEAEREGLLPIFPPGTLRERVAESRGDVVPDEVLAAASDVLESYLYERTPLTHEDAIDLLNFITDHYGRRALRIKLEASGGGVPFEQALQRLHARVEYALAEGYREAYLNRVIAGHIATGEHKVRHVSGRLPIRTFVSSATIKRWYIGGS